MEYNNELVQKLKRDINNYAEQQCLKHESVILPTPLYNNYMYILTQYNILRKNWDTIIPKEHKDTCLTIAVEELSELQKEVCKLHRGKLRRDKLIEEIADVQIIIEWLKTIAEIKGEEIGTIKQQKIDRIIDRYKNGEFK